MTVLVGVHPGGRNSFAVSGLYFDTHLPGQLISARSHSGVNAVLDDIMGVIGEWGGIEAAAIDAPLTWSGSPNGWRRCDVVVKKRLPDWAPKGWLRSPNSLPGAVSIQGPALVWALALEIKNGNLPKHKVFETHPRACLARIARELRTSVLGYRKRDVSAATRARHVGKILEHLLETGILKLECQPPKTPEELDSIVAAVAALGAARPETGLVTHAFAGGEIRPVGNRAVLLLDALP